MKISRNKTMASLIALFLVLTIAVTLVALPTANAHTPAWNYPTWCYCVVSNKILGVNQPEKIIYWINSVPPTASGAFGDRWTFTVNVTAPDGTTETLGPFTSDPVGSGFTFYTPTQVGTYTIQAHFPGATITGYPTQNRLPPTSISVNDTYAASTSDPVEVIVQQEPIQPWPEAPLPTQFWTRPINNANQKWWPLAGNWLDSVSAFGGANAAQNVGPTTNFGYGLGTESAHIMWATPAFTGGTMDARFGDYSYVTSHYEGLTFSPLILDGKIFYNAINSEMKEGWYCLDLYTGETLYFHNTTGPVTGAGGGFDAHGGITGESLAFAQIYDPELPNQMGGYPYLWSTTAATPNTYMMFDAYTGNYICSIKNVPAGSSFFGFSMPWGTAVYGKDGSILRYNIVGTGANMRLLCWNTTQAIWWKGTIQQYQNRDYSGFSGNNYNSWRPYLNYTFDGNNGYSLNVSIPAVQGSILAVREDQYVIGGTAGSNNEQGIKQGNLWALNLDPEEGAMGVLLWNRTFTPPSSAGNLTVSMGTVDPEDGVFLFSCALTRTRWGYSLATGQQLWKSEPEEPMKYYGMGNTNIYQGMLLSGTYLNGGILISYNITTGEILWTYEPAQIGSESPFGDYPAQLACIADGKIYIYSSPLWRTQPLWRGSYLRCINASNGAELWKILHYGAAVIADGFLVGLNYYDNQIYCYGKGPSATTVTAPDIAVPLGSSVVIRGTVTDQCVGAKKIAEKLGFANGVPAVSDASQEAWMEWLYAQQGKPTNATGVEVSLDTIDPNGNYVHIDTVTSDTSGTFKKMWIPEVPGEYTVIATFAGTESYYSSSAETAIGVSEAPPATAAPEYPQPIDPTLTIVGVGIAIIIAVAIVGILLFRKRP
jgi:hypothetical protein